MKKMTFILACLLLIGTTTNATAKGLTTLVTATNTKPCKALTAALTGFYNVVLYKICTNNRGVILFSRS